MASILVSRGIRPVVQVRAEPPAHVQHAQFKSELHELQSPELLQGCRVSVVEVVQSVHPTLQA